MRLIILLLLLVVSSTVYSQTHYVFGTTYSEEGNVYYDTVTVQVVQNRINITRGIDFQITDRILTIDQQSPLFLPVGTNGEEVKVQYYTVQGMEREYLFAFQSGNLHQVSAIINDERLTFTDLMALR